MRAVCIARHRFLSEHIGSVFLGIGIESTPVVGFEDGMRVARSELPDLVICDYDLLVAAPLGQWEGDPVLGTIPIVAVSLTRRPEEVHLLDINGIAGFLYLAAMDDAAIARVVNAATARRVRPPAHVMQWDTIHQAPLRAE